MTIGTGILSFLLSAAHGRYRDVTNKLIGMLCYVTDILGFRCLVIFLHSSALPKYFWLKYLFNPNFH